MDPLQPWVDAQEMKRLAEALMSTPARMHDVPPDAGFNGDFVGFAEDSSEEKKSPPPAKPSLPPTTDLARNGDAVVSNDSRVRGPLLDCLRRFHEWLQAQGHTQGLFVLDEVGDLLFDDADHGRLHFVARSMAKAAKQSPQGGGRVQVKIGSVGLLEVIPVETLHGRLVLAMIVDHPLSSAEVTSLITALHHAVAPTSP